MLILLSQEQTEQEAVDSYDASNPCELWNVAVLAAKKEQNEKANQLFDKIIENCKNNPDLVARAYNEKALLCSKRGLSR